MWYTTDENGKRTTTDSYNKADRVYCGSAAPKFTGGWMNSFSYKGFTLTANFDFVYGNLLYNQSRELLDSDGAYADYNSMKLKSGWKRWEKKEDIATHPKALTEVTKTLTNRLTLFGERQLLQLAQLITGVFHTGEVMRETGLATGQRLLQC